MIGPWSVVRCFFGLWLLDFGLRVRTYLTPNDEPQPRTTDY